MPNNEAIDLVNLRPRKHRFAAELRAANLGHSPAAALKTSQVLAGLEISQDIQPISLS
ncbi:hypothetical protein AB3X96_37055 [Paraburkholderia sp. BR13439]|uniref:hypothetical protein n=1 Tax=unclassified Paraburkholderia TaxID=2615204 RepID=UPI0034CE50DE